MNFKWIINFCGTVTITLGTLISTPSFAFPDELDSAQQQVAAVPLKDIKRFATVISQVKRYYVQPIDDEKLFNNAIRGLLSNLDPHSAYLDTDDLKDLQTATSGKFGGIGIEVLPENGLIKVVTPLDGTPAEKAGVKTGDLIVRIDNTLVQDMTLREAINMMRGVKGSKVSLTVIRQGSKKPLKFDLVRDIIKVEAVKSKLLENGYGYVRIAVFQAPVKDNLIQAIDKLKKDANGNLKGLILDLRNNPGGLLESAIEVSDIFLDVSSLKGNKLIVYTKGRVPGNDIKAYATSADIIKGVPIVVIINGGSASAAEIVAGALKDHRRAIIIGTRSFGKGSVQTVIPIDNNSAMKLTTALYYTPSGHSIQAEGIKPDVIVPEFQLEKQGADVDAFEPVFESDLDRHLANEKGTQSGEVSIKEQTKKIGKEERSLASSDFQLYEALQVLKGLSSAIDYAPLK